MSEFRINRQGLILLWRLVILAVITVCFVNNCRAETNSFLQVFSVHSEVLNTDRTIRVALPSRYFAQSDKRYPVLYLHDGQNVFSSAGTNAAFGWGNWEVDLTSSNLAHAGKMNEIILVGIDNSTLRMEEYSGHHSADTNNPSPFDRYESFLIGELIPAMNSRYRTSREPAKTAVMGSSLGGICSIALAWDHPEVFGAAASLSGAFQINHREFLQQQLKGYQGNVKPIRIYIDSGVTDFTGGDDNRKLSEAVVTELKRIGWGNDLDYYVDEHPLTPKELAQSGLRPDKWEEARRSQHNEFYWRRRAELPLIFLFPVQW